MVSIKLDQNADKSQKFQKICVMSKKPTSCITGSGVFDLIFCNFEHSDNEATMKLAIKLRVWRDSTTAQATAVLVFQLQTRHI